MANVFVLLMSMRVQIRLLNFFKANNINIIVRNMANETKFDKILEDLQSNPYFDKYASKIAKFQKVNPDLFIERIEKKSTKIQEKKEHNQEHSIPLGKEKQDVKAQLQSNDTLSSVMNIDMIQDKSKEEIGEIWREYHKQKDYICATMTPEQFDKTFQFGKKYSTFLLPLPREQGYEFIVSQFYGKKIYMTPLLWYHAHKENAPECLKLSYYDEFKNNKGIVLMRGEFDMNFMNVQEAQYLVNELQLYYGTDDPERLKLLKTFNKMPNDFKHSDLIRQVEKCLQL